MKTFAIAAFCCVLPTLAFAQVAPPSTANKAPGIDFSVEVKDAKGKPFPVCEKSDESNTNKCLEWSTWTLASAAYLALSTPKQKPQGGGASAEDIHNTALGFRLYGATAPVDLITHDRDALVEALLRGATVPMAIGYAACLMVDTEGSCESGK